MAGRSQRSILALAATVLLIAAGGLYAWSPDKPPSVAAGAVTIGGPFTLTAQDGKPLSDTDLKGKPFAVFFGFTHCPEICPTTLWEMSEALKALGADAYRLKVLFISVDPSRDTADILSRYLQSFDPRIVGLTGAETDIDALGKAYRAYWRKVPLDSGDYTMEHTASIFLMDANGRFAGTIAYEEEMDLRLRKLRKLIAGASS